MGLREVSALGPEGVQRCRVFVFGSMLVYLKAMHNFYTQWS